jgi:antitoxin component YwqK of YwqJK toxin-antitoxin module
MKTLKSSIPQKAVEKPIREYEEENVIHLYRMTNCFLNGNLVGQRFYTQAGVLVLETPLKDGLKHGWERTWDDDGTLLLVEPYVTGQIHGTARQYGRGGKVIGTYTFVHGTGFDVWRQENEDKTVFISEIRQLQNGTPHGHEWQFASPKQDLWHERNWYLGKLHGIERIWNSKGRLRRGYPRFYVLDKVISRQEYLKLSQTDKTLPTYRAADDVANRIFPAEIQDFLSWQPT